MQVISFKFEITYFLIVNFGVIITVGIPTRYAVATVAFVNFIYVYMLRLNVNIVIVAMVNYTAIPHTNITTAEECGHDAAQNNNTEIRPDFTVNIFFQIKWIKEFFTNPFWM